MNDAEITRLRLFLTAKHCDHCNAPLEGNRRVILIPSSLKVYCSDGCSIWGEAKDRGLVLKK